MQRKIDQWFEEHRDEMVQDIMRLCRIRSVREESREGMPYGEGPARVLAEALSMAEGMGFATRNYENYVGTVDYNDKETELLILAHLDVVPEGTGWTVTEPYAPKVVDGRLYARGSADDKGPAVAALYALRVLRELDVSLSRNVRLLLGTDEERGSSDLKYYFEREKAPRHSFSPDASYPVCNVEKGSFGGSFTAEWAESAALPRIVYAKGGQTSNVVPRDAEAVVEGLSVPEVDAVARAYADKTKARFTVTTSEDGKGVKITVLGEGAHASTPEKGNNAALALVEMLCGLPLAPCEGVERLRAVAEIFPHGDGAGQAAGVAQSDEISGALTLNIGLFEYTLTGLRGVIDSRVPVCANEDNMSRVLERRLADRGLTLSTTKMRAPHHTPADSPLVRTLLHVYEEVTGQKGYCYSMGGGTYVHNIEGGVAFGCAKEEVDNHMHGPDEFAVVEDLVESARMFARVIVGMCG